MREGSPKCKVAMYKGGGLRNNEPKRRGRNEGMQQNVKKNRTETQKAKTAHKPRTKNARKRCAYVNAKAQTANERK